MSARMTINKNAIDRLRKKLIRLKAPMDQATAYSLAIQVVTEMKAMIAKGITPIRGEPRFPAYKNPDKYPGKRLRKLFRKRNRPVNLFLSGDFIRSLIHLKNKVTRQGVYPVIGYSDDLSKRKESGHREGVHGQPKRPTIPDLKNGEEFAQRIQRIISLVFRERIRELIK